METFERREYKYYVPVELLDTLRNRFLASMEHDSFARQCDQHRYVVRSIYLDTRRFLFYHEKKSGLKIRKKLRIRTYNQSDSQNGTYLEIKRKYDNTIRKERVGICSDQIHDLLNGGTTSFSSEQRSFLDRTTIDRYIYLVKRLQLVEKALVTYEREALQACDDSRLRVTFDLNVRSFLNPDLNDLYRETDLRTVEDSQFILEIKFNQRMPIWVRNIVREFGLRVQAISKYCNGIDAWLPLDQDTLK